MKLSVRLLSMRTYIVILALTLLAVASIGSTRSRRDALTKSRRLDAVAAVDRSRRDALAALYQQDRQFQISRDYKLAYIHIPKTGGSTIEESQLFQEKRSFGGSARGHYRVDFMLADAAERDISDFTTAATIRHPCDRFLSAFHYVRGHKGQAVQVKAEQFHMNEFETVDEWVEWLGNTPDMWRQLQGNFNHFIPMTRWVMHMGSNSHVFGIDVVMCQDHWNEGVDRLFRTLQKPVVPGVTMHKNEGRSAHPSCDALDEKTRVSIMKAYELDACLFGYGEWTIPKHDPHVTCVGTSHSKRYFTRRYRDCVKKIMWSRQPKKDTV